MHELLVDKIVEGCRDRACEPYLCEVSQEAPGMLEKCIVDLARERDELRLQRITGFRLITQLGDALNDLIAAYDAHPFLPKEDGELPVLDRARAIYADTVRKLADGRI